MDKTIIAVGDEVTYLPKFEKFRVSWTDGHVIRGGGQRCVIEDVVGVRRRGKLVWVTGISGKSGDSHGHSTR